MVSSIALSTFTIYVTDGKGGQASTLITVNTHELDIPVTKVVNNGTVTGGLGLSAGEQGLMTYSLGNGPSKGTVTVNADGTYTYTATTAGWNESDTFTIVGTTLVGEGTLAQYEEALKAVTFSATQGAALVRGLTISVTDSDGVENIAPGFVTVNVAAAPTLPPLVTPIAGGGFTIGGNPAKIVSGVDIVDGDSGKLSKVVVK
ncbi:Ig-like domain-containing protein, partial [Mycolicibacterium neoaurum]